MLITSGSNAAPEQEHLTEAPCGPDWSRPALVIRGWSQGRIALSWAILTVLGLVVVAGCVASPAGAAPPEPGVSDAPASTPSPTTSPEDLTDRERAYPPIEIVTVEESLDLLPPFSADEVSRASELALADPAVGARLAGHRYLVLYVTPPPELSEASKEIDPQTLPEVIVYDYSTDRWLAIPVDLATGSVGRFKERNPATDGWPMIVALEVQDAVSIALADPAVTALIRRGYALIDRPVRVGFIGGDRICVTNRCVAVIVYSKAVERMAMIQVDLGVRRVVGIDAE